MVPEEVLERAAVDDVSPRYLRKQKPANAAKRRLRHAGSKVRRGALVFLLAAAATGTVGGVGYFLLFSPAMLLRPGQIDISGAQYVSRRQILSIFSGDMGRSVLRVPLARRLAAMESIPWVRSAAVERILPNRLHVSIEEREPVAFLSTNEGMKLIDADGVILDRPPGAHFNLPVVSGLDESTPAPERVRRLQMFSRFLTQIATVLPGADGDVSQANLSNPDDVQATLDGLPILAGQGPVVVHFGDADFASRFRLFLSNFADWQALAGNVEAVDLRYGGEALVTPETPYAAPKPVSLTPAGAALTPPLPALTGQPLAQVSSVSRSGKIRRGRVRR
jgi:cell division protein FtsQ